MKTLPWFFCVFLLALPALGLAQPATLRRTLDPVALSGEPLKAVWGAKTAELRLMAARGGKLAPIPFQVDKRDPDGAYMISGATVPPEVSTEVGFDDKPESDKRARRIKKFEKRKDDLEEAVRKGKITQAEADRRKREAYFEEQEDEIDYNDELVFMARDAGSRAARQDWPVADGVELQVKDPSDGGTAWVYLLDWKGKLPPPANPKDYLTYDPQRDQVTSDRIRMDFIDDKPLIMNGAFVKGPDGKELPNLMDRFRFQIVVRPTILFCVALNFDENNVKSFTIGYKDGPVRVIRRNLFWLTIAGMKLPFVPQALVYFMFYDNGLMAPTQVENPFDPRYMLCKGSVGGGGIDFRAPLAGARVYTSRNPGGFLLDGYPSADEGLLVRDREEWAFLLKEDTGRGFLIRVVQGPELKAAGVNLKFDVIDDVEKKRSPEEDPGARYVGFFVNIREVPKGTLTLGFYIYPVAEMKAGDEKAYLRILDAPLEATAGE